MFNYTCLLKSYFQLFCSCCMRPWLTERGDSTEGWHLNIHLSKSYLCVLVRTVRLCWALWLSVMTANFGTGNKLIYSYGSKYFARNNKTFISSFGKRKELLEIWSPLENTSILGGRYCTWRNDHKKEELAFYKGGEVLILQRFIVWLYISLMCLMHRCIHRSLMTHVYYSSLVMTIWEG